MVAFYLQQNIERVSQGDRKFFPKYRESLRKCFEDLSGMRRAALQPTKERVFKGAKEPGGSRHKQSQSTYCDRTKMKKSGLLAESGEQLQIRGSTSTNSSVISRLGKQDNGQCAFASGVLKCGM